MQGMRRGSRRSHPLPPCLSSLGLRPAASWGSDLPAAASEEVWMEEKIGPRDAVSPKQTALHLQLGWARSHGGRF